MEEYKEAANELLRGIQYMVDQATSETTKIYGGYVQSINGDGSCNININGQSYSLKQFGTGEVKEGTNVRVFVPQGNMNLAWFITATTGGGGVLILDADSYGYENPNEKSDWAVTPVEGRVYLQLMEE